jgi:Domain of unknown function (DU1801)
VDIKDQIDTYFDGLPAPKRADMLTLHKLICSIAPDARLWFLDGKDENGKVVSNPNVGYGVRIIKYADGKTREFYKVGISANSTGISVYIMGYDDKNYLPSTFGKLIGKATVTGYCIKFRALKDIDLGVLDKALRNGIELESK